MPAIAIGKHFRENSGEKHNRNAANGWYRYDSRFALPVYGEDGGVERYNAFHASMLVRHDANGELYLYDIMDIKKKQSTLSSHEALLGKKPIPFLQYRVCSGNCQA